MKKVLLALLAILLLVPATAFAEKKPLTVDQYREYFTKVEEKLSDNAEETYKTFIDLLKFKARDVTTEDLPDGTKVKFYQLDEVNSGVYGSFDENKTVAYVLKGLPANAVEGYMKALGMSPSGKFLDMMATPTGYSTTVLFAKGEKAGVTLATYQNKDDKGKRDYTFSLTIFKDLAFYDKMKALYEANNKE